MTPTKLPDPGVTWGHRRDLKAEESPGGQQEDSAGERMEQGNLNGVGMKRHNQDDDCVFSRQPRPGAWSTDGAAYLYARPGVGKWRLMSRV